MMDWKYVVLQCVNEHDAVYEYPIIFPKEIVRFDLASAILNISDIKENYITRIVSAGYLTMTPDGIFCYGESESLGVSAREDKDRELIELMGRNNFGKFRVGTLNS